MSTSFKRPDLGSRIELPGSSRVNQSGGGVEMGLCLVIKQVQTQAFRLDLVQASLALALWPNSVVLRLNLNEFERSDCFVKNGSPLRSIKGN
jgi:hypothetical protein